MSIRLTVLGFLLSIILLICGIEIIVCTAKGKSALKKTSAYATGFIFLIWGGGAGISILLENENMTMIFLMGGCAVFLIDAGVRNIVNVFRCNTVVQAVYVRSTIFNNKGQTRYAPVFQYKFEGKEYEQQTAQVFSKEYMQTHLEEGQWCEIYICPSLPQACIVEKKVKGTDILLIFNGLVFLLLVIFINLNK